MIIQRIQNLFKKSEQKKREVIGTSFVLTNAITMQANLSGGRLRIH